MKAIIVISVDVPDPPDGLGEVLSHIDPPSIPYFDHQVRVAIDPAAQQVLDWLDEP